MEKVILQDLLATEALQVCEPGQPFWYTSGLFGPYYINTHFLYGDKEAAADLLQAIEQAAREPLSLPEKIDAMTFERYQKDPVYARVIATAAKRVESFSFDFISGGERRDFFFSFPVARLLQKDHLTILKDGTAIYTKFSGESLPADRVHLTGKKAFHIADLATEASSYMRAWLPAVRSLGAVMTDTLAIVDRHQEAKAVLAKEQVALHSLICFSKEVLAKAQADGLLSPEQVQMIADYTADPIRFVKDFLAAHPNFLTKEIKKGGKTAERAHRLEISDYLVTE